MNEQSEIYLVWSNEHRGWWRPGAGYTPKLSQARIFGREQALKICTDAIPGDALRFGMLPEIPVRLSDLEQMQKDFHREYPAIGPEPWE